MGGGNKKFWFSALKKTYLQNCASQDKVVAGTNRKSQTCFWLLRKQPSMTVNGHYTLYGTHIYSLKLIDRIKNIRIEILLTASKCHKQTPNFKHGLISEIVPIKTLNGVDTIGNRCYSAAFWHSQYGSMTQQCTTVFYSIKCIRPKIYLNINMIFRKILNAIYHRLVVANGYRLNIACLN